MPCCQEIPAIAHIEEQSISGVIFANLKQQAGLGTTSRCCLQLDSGKEIITRLRLELQRESGLAEPGQPAEGPDAIDALKERIQQVPLPVHPSHLSGFGVLAMWTPDLREQASFWMKRSSG